MHHKSSTRNFCKSKSFADVGRCRDGRGPQMWEANTFNGDNVIVDKTLIKEVWRPSIHDCYVAS
jgi:hypothetical protein